MKINWKIRFQNPHFIVQIIMAVLVPMLSYAGLTAQDLTTWGTLGNLLLEAISNPYCLMLVLVSVYNAIIDNTTPGLNDSQHVLEKINIKDK